MRITNKFGMPEVLVRFLERDSYSRGTSRISVTQLIDAPRVAQLRAAHDAELEEDVSSQLWLLMGKAIHHILEHGTQKADGTTTEERLFEVVDGWTISGQIDLQETADGFVISDWKMTSVWAVMSDKVAWENQLNLYRWLAERKKGKVAKLQVVAFLRDWDKRDAQKSSFGDGAYPQAPMKVLPIKMWTMEEADAYVRDRVKRHQLAAIEAEMGVEPPPCTDEERWAKEPKWVCIKPGAERASRVFPTEGEAMVYAAGKNGLAPKGGAGLIVEKRAAPPARCSGGWCRVSDHCRPWQEEKAKNGW